MIKGALFTIGIIVVVGSVGYGAIAIMAAGMSDNPYEAQNVADNSWILCGIAALVGVGMIVGALFVP